MEPLFKRNYPRDQIKRKNALGPFGVIVNREGDTLGEKRIIGHQALAVELTQGQIIVPLEEALVVQANVSRRREHLVEKGGWVVPIEQVAHGNMISREAKRSSSDIAALVPCRSSP